MEAAFKKFLQRFGQDVQVTTRTPQLLDEEEVLDEDGEPVFDEELYILRARMNILRGNERVIQNAIMKPGDCIGRFLLSDIDYLNTDSYVYLEFYDGPSYKFRIYEILPQITHLQVLMKRDE